jgi:hypothetical protein
MLKISASLGLLASLGSSKQVGLCFICAVFRHLIPSVQIEVKTAQPQSQRDQR